MNVKKGICPEMSLSALFESAICYLTDIGVKDPVWVGLRPSGGVTSVEGGGDGVDAVSISAVAYRRVLEAEAGGAALRVAGVQVKITKFTPRKTDNRKRNVKKHLHENQAPSRFCLQM